MGWIFVLLGVFLIAIGSFLVYYGQDLLRHPTDQTSVSMHTAGLEPLQDKLLESLSFWQRELSASKLVIERSGRIVVFSREGAATKKIDLLGLMLGGSHENPADERAFEALMESMPEIYVRRLPEARLDNPFVITLTEEAMRYLRGR